MKKVITNNMLVIVFAALASIASLSASWVLGNVEWFQASGAIVTLCGVALAARKIIRLGFEEFVRDEQTIDGGKFGQERTSEEIETAKQFEADMRAYPQSIWLIGIGTIIWAYGGLFLKEIGLCS
jgi:hypothetical protein